MTTPLNTIMTLLPNLTTEQLQAMEGYAAWFCRQNLSARIAALPNSSLASVGVYIDIFANPQQSIVIPPPPPAPVVENAVPAPFQSDLLPPLFPDLPASPLVFAEGDFTSPGHSRQQHPRLKPLSPSPEPEPNEGCECFNCVAHREYNRDKEEDDDYEETRQANCPGCRDGEWGLSPHAVPGGCQSSSSNFIG